MPDANIATSSQLNNHELDKLVQKMTNLLKLASVQAMNAQMNPSVYKYKPKKIKVGKKKAVSYPSVQNVVAERLNILDAGTRRIVRLDIGRDMDVTNEIRNWGIDMRSSKSVFEQIDTKAHFAFINGTTFSKSAMQNMVSEFSSLTTPLTPVSLRDSLSADLDVIHARYGSYLPGTWRGDFITNWWDSVQPTVVVNKGLKFRVHEVKCVDETNPEWPGHDEIAWGGVAVDDKDVATKIPEYYVGGGFDDGDIKRYSPVRIIHTFSMGKQYPQTYFVTLALAEKDSSGMSKFIEDLYQAIKAHVQLIMTALGAAAGAAIGGAIGGSVGTSIAGPLGAIIGIAAGAILGALIGWLVGVLKDDIFAPQASSVTFYSTNNTFAGGSLVSPALYFHYRDHGGHYRVKYDWEIVR